MQLQIFTNMLDTNCGSVEGNEDARPVRNPQRKYRSLNFFIEAL